ncbi:O-antigen ligase domain-containing protein [Gordonia sp. C13]|uniref:O-antigen ligase domain-containing protein n=1 Tax=Gordonia sp. C13 TaxID=2935078 RepID=UPI00200B2D5D|nr:O-antigen ligase domain-containing protein [Gordonia sp. C13]MCK8613328.1 O-antigen ligase domain-containing protein [Gordonia sp. C13]
MGIVRSLAIVAVVAAGTFGCLLAGESVMTAAFLGLALIAGSFVGLQHPTWLLWALAVVVALLPAGYVPGTPVPLIFTLTMAVLLATVLHPRDVSTFTPLEYALMALVVVAGLSVAATMQNGIDDILEYVKWTSATLLVVALLRLRADQLRTFGQVFVVASSLSAAVGLAMLTVDKSARTFDLLSPFGYDASSAGRFVFNGAAVTARLSGTYIDPNAAGIGFLAALMISLLVFDGFRRWALALLLFAAVAMTLSRAAIFSVVLALLLMLAFHTMSTRGRTAIIGTLVGGMALLSAIPASRRRIFSSFGDSDTGSTARSDALREFPEKMSGHWLFGHGWGIAEFKDPEKAFNINYVANAPLLSVYRGGLLVGILFTAIMIYGCYLAYRCLRSSRSEVALYGGCFIAFFVLGMQLDFSTVSIPVSVTDLSLMLVYLVVALRSSESTDLFRQAQSRELSVRTRAPR